MELPSRQLVCLLTSILTHSLYSLELSVIDTCQKYWVRFNRNNKHLGMQVNQTHSLMLIYGRVYSWDYRMVTPLRIHTWASPHFVYATYSVNPGFIKFHELAGSRRSSQKRRECYTFRCVEFS